MQYGSVPARTSEADFPGTSRRARRTPYRTLVQEHAGPVYMLKGEDNIILTKPMSRGSYIDRYNKWGPGKVPLKAIAGYETCPDLYRLKITPKWGLRSLVYVDFDAHPDDPDRLADLLRLVLRGCVHLVLQRERPGRGGARAGPPRMERMQPTTHMEGLP